MKTRHRLPGEIVWAIALAIAGAVIFPLSAELAGLQDADGILTSLISTQKLTWYFWEQDRILNLIPALASPIHDLIWNQRAQLFLRAFMSLLAPLGILALFSRPPQGRLLTTVSTQLVLGMTLSGAALFNVYAQHNPFSSSLVMFGLSIAAFNRLRGVTAITVTVVIAFIAYATNIALVVLTAPLLALCTLTAVQPRRELIRLTAVQLIAVALAYIHAKIYGQSVTSFGVHIDAAAVRSGWVSVAEHLRLGSMLALFALASAAAWRMRTREALTAWLVAAGMPLAISAMSCLSWLQLNNFDIRYYLVFIIVYSTFCCFLIVGALPKPLFRSWFDPIASAGCLLVVFLFGLHGLSATPTEVISPRWRAESVAAGKLAAAENAQLIVGQFWDVWPAVFMAREELRDMGRAGAPMYGAAFRGTVLSKRVIKLMRDHDLTSVCFQEDVGDCVRTTNFFITTAHPVSLIPDSLKRVSIGDRYVLVYRVTARP